MARAGAERRTPRLVRRLQGRAAAAAPLAALALLALAAWRTASPPRCATAAQRDARCERALPRAGGQGNGSGSDKGASVFSGAHDSPYADTDVVGTLAAPSCVTRAVLFSVAKFVRPRSVVLLAADAAACADLAAEHAAHLRVRCVSEDSVLPGVTRAALDAYFDKRRGDDGAASVYSGRTLGGWYMQQLLKLGAAVSPHPQLQDLSSRFVVWDMDMIALRTPSFESFSHAPGSVGAQVTLLHAGGNAVRAYDAAVAGLARVPSAYAPDGSSYVSNAMLFRRDVVQELLGVIGGGGGREGEELDLLRGADVPAASSDSPWAWRILDAALASTDPRLGFSEYQTYVHRRGLR
eukprot:PRCOL_00005524-RA